MKHRNGYLRCLVLLAAVLGAAGLPAQQKQPASAELTVVSYNIRHGEGMDGKTDYARIARHFLDQHADVVAVQEVDSVTGRSGGQDVLKRLADAAQMHPTFARAIAFDGGAYGVGILSREQPLSVRRIPLPGREEARVLLVAEFADYYVACTHLSLTPDDQLASLPILREVAAAAQKPFFLAGDWNAQPSDPFIRQLRKDFTLLNNLKLPTWPADVPKDLIDYVAVWKHFPHRVKRQDFTVIPDTVSSDHRPIVARVRMARQAR